MPTYDFRCEYCGKLGREWRKEGPPRFCSKKCQGKVWTPYPNPRKWPISPEMHEEIRLLYQTKVSTGGCVVRAYAEKVGYPRWKISRYAIQQGWIATNPKMPAWSPKELHILEKCAHLSMETIQKKLKEAGFIRSVTAILLKRKRLELPSNLQGQSATQVSKLFGIDIHGLVRWIDSGWLKAIKRGTKRTSKQGGDTYYIKPEDIKEFIVSYVEEIDIRKVDKYWFVGLLVGNGHKVQRPRASESPCIGCKWEKTDKDLCAPTCDKIEEWQEREQERAENDNTEMAARRLLEIVEEG
jgi:hypothetical protein